MSVPTNENGLALAALDFGASTRGKWARSESEGVPTGPTAGPETSPEAEQGLLGRRRWAVAHSVCKDPHSRDPRET